MHSGYNSRRVCIACYRSFKTIRGDADSRTLHGLFPALSIIEHYCDSDAPIPDGFSVDSETVAFILFRLKHGRPITTISLERSDQKPFEYPLDLSTLDEAKGLNVTYKFSEANKSVQHIFGSGQLAGFVETF